MEDNKQEVNKQAPAHKALAVEALDEFGKRLEALKAALAADTLNKDLVCDIQRLYWTMSNKVDDYLALTVREAEEKAWPRDMAEEWKKTKAKKPTDEEEMKAKAAKEEADKKAKEEAEKAAKVKEEEEKSAKAKEEEAKAAKDKEEAEKAAKAKEEEDKACKKPGEPQK